MSNQIYADEIEKEIILMEQELILKRKLLEECRQNLISEIQQHTETKSTLTKCMDQNKELQIQLEVNLKAAKKLEEENNRIRDNSVKVEVQLSAYLKERQNLIDQCYQTGLENAKLKNEVIELKESLKGHDSFQENYKIRQLETAKLVNEISTKQETLRREQSRLEAICKEGLRFAAKISEEANFQAKFVRVANANCKEMEEEMIRLITAVKELEEKYRKKSPEVVEKDEYTYLKEWQLFQQETKIRIEELLNENKRLNEELNFATTQIERLLKNL